MLLSLLDISSMHGTSREEIPRWVTPGADHAAGTGVVYVPFRFSDVPGTPARANHRSSPTQSVEKSRAVDRSSWSMVLPALTEHHDYGRLGNRTDQGHDLGKLETTADQVATGGTCRTRPVDTEVRGTWSGWLVST